MTDLACTVCLWCRSALDQLLAKLIACIDKSLKDLRAAHVALETQFHHRRDWLLRKIAHLQKALKHNEHKQQHTRAHLKRVQDHLRRLAAALKSLQHRRHETNEESKHVRRTLRETTEHEREKQKLFGEQLELLRALLKLLTEEAKEHHHHHKDIDEDHDKEIKKPAYATA